MFLKSKRNSLVSKNIPTTSGFRDNLVDPCTTVTVDVCMFILFIHSSVQYKVSFVNLHESRATNSIVFLVLLEINPVINL